jgi:hypothetical protein
MVTHRCRHSARSAVATASWAAAACKAQSARKIRRQSSHGGPGGGWSSWWTTVGRRCPQRAWSTPSGSSPSLTSRCTAQSSDEIAQHVERITGCSWRGSTADRSGLDLAGHRHLVARCAAAVARTPRRTRRPRCRLCAACRDGCPDHPSTAGTTGAAAGSSQPPRQRVAKSDGLILGQRQHARTSDVRIQLDPPCTAS